MKLSKNLIGIVNYVKSQKIISGFLWLDTLQTFVSIISGKYCDIVNSIRFH